MKKTFVFKKPKWLRRIGSAFIDLLAAVIIALLFSYAVTPITNTIYDGEELWHTYNNYAVETKLFQFNEDGTTSLINDITTYDDNLTFFYLNCTDDKLNEYLDKKKERPDLFVYNELSNTYEELNYIGNQELIGKYMLFYSEVRDYCVNTYLNDYLNKQEGYKDSLVVLNRMLYTNILICSFVGLLIIYLIIPMIHKEGKTIGKMMFRLKIISKVGNDPKPTKVQILYRQLITVLFEYVLSVATFGLFGIPLPITLLFSMSMLFIGKYNQSFHDFATSTLLVDESLDTKPLNAGEKYEITYNDLRKENFNV